MKKGMFYKADPLIFDKARELRNKLTPAEQTFWLRLKEQFPEYKFRRQHPISIYIADFYCHKLKLVIEIDGSVHDSEEARLADGKRQKYLENLNLTVIRFTNEQIRSEVEDVIKALSSIIVNLTAK
ncbi:MAG TPA: endonuclease domain-containing protein [Chitinophagaceae bacterium]|nr:endonuclease domain-containing protein [Chitinophagaceae bacterium]